MEAQYQFPGPPNEWGARCYWVQIKAHGTRPSATVPRQGFVTLGFARMLVEAGVKLRFPREGYKIYDATGADVTQ